MLRGLRAKRLFVSHKGPFDFGRERLRLECLYDSFVVLSIGSTASPNLMPLMLSQPSTGLNGLAVTTSPFVADGHNAGVLRLPSSNGTSRFPR